ncbi:MAG: type II secretory pathway component PulF [Kiritimatiellia bacterium]|jgi:type II secretory pathway component PulF
MNRPAKAQFVRSWATLLDSGIPMEESLDHQRSHAAQSGARVLASELRDRIRAGQDLDEALALTRAFVSVPERAMIKAGTQTGRLPECLRLLADQWEEQYRAHMMAVARMILPAIVVHLAVPVVNLPILFTGGHRFAKFISGCVEGFIGLYVFAGVLFLLFKVLKAVPGFEAVTYRTPLLGRWLRSAAASRFCQALYFYLVAGVPMLRALPGAGAASGSHTLSRLAEAGRARMEHEAASLADVLRDARMLSSEQLAILESGEHAGQLDSTLQHVATLSRDSAARALNRLALIVPSLIYFGVAILVVMRIFSYVSSYMKMLSNIMNGG